MTAHWGFPDPAAFVGPKAKKRAMFADVFRMISMRIGIFVSLPLTALDRLSLQKHLDDIGRSFDRSA